MSEKRSIDHAAIRPNWYESEIAELEAMSKAELIELFIKCKEIWYSYMRRLEEEHETEINSCYKTLTDQNQAISKQLKDWALTWETRIQRLSVQSSGLLNKVHSECNDWQNVLSRLEGELSRLGNR